MHRFVITDKACTVKSNVGEYWKRLVRPKGFSILAANEHMHKCSDEKETEKIRLDSKVVGKSQELPPLNTSLCYTSLMWDPQCQLAQFPLIYLL